MPREFLVDFTELEDFEAVPAGVYVLRLVLTGQEQVEYGQEKGTPYLTLKFEIVQPDEYAGRRLLQRLMLKGKGTRLTAEFLRAYGYDVQRGSTFRMPLYEMKDGLVAARIVQREFNGQIQSEIRNFMPVDAVNAA